MQEALEDKMLISILAGVTITQLKALVHSTTKIIRAMPNTPCKVSLDSLLCLKLPLRNPYGTKD